MGESDSSWLSRRVGESLRHEWEERRDLYANSKGEAYKDSLVFRPKDRHRPDKPEFRPSGSDDPLLVQQYSRAAIVRGV